MSTLRNGTILALCVGVAILGTDRLKRTATDRQISQQLEALQQAQRDLRDQQDSLREQQGRAIRALPSTWNPTAMAVSARAAAEPVDPPLAAPPRKPPPTLAEMQSNLDRVFTAESSDAAWSASAQETVRTGLGRVLGEGASLASLRCGSTMCRIETSHRNADDYHKFLERSFMASEGVLWNGATFSSLTYDSGGEAIAVSYLAREGAALPTLSR